MTIYDLPYFEPLRLDEEYFVFDLELIQRKDWSSFTVAIVVQQGRAPCRPNILSTKVLKKKHTSIFGKSSMSLKVSRNNDCDLRSLSLNPKNGIYHTIAESTRDKARSINMYARNDTLLAQLRRPFTTQDATPMPHYNTDCTTSILQRTCLSHHRFLLDTAGYERVDEEYHYIPPCHSRPYSGGGHFIFDAASLGKRELLTSLYCTGFTQRHRPKKGDITLAELRLPPSGDTKAPSISSWDQFFRDGRAELHVSTRGIDACFCGEHVYLDLQRPRTESTRYHMEHGQALEAIFIAVAIMLISVQDEGSKGKKWEVSSQRDALEQRVDSWATTANATLSALQVNDIAGIPRNLLGVRGGDASAYAAQSPAHRRVVQNVEAGAARLQAAVARNPELRELMARQTQVARDTLAAANGRDLRGSM